MIDFESTLAGDGRRVTPVRCKMEHLGAAGLWGGGCSARAPGKMRAPQLEEADDTGGGGGTIGAWS